MSKIAARIGVTLADAPCGSPLYGEALRLRESVLRQPLGLTVTPRSSPTMRGGGISARWPTAP
jgi:hypothetical protein